MSDVVSLLKLESISKQYPGCLANDDISLSIKEGEIHALLGENGAGKSTLVKIIFGLLKPSKGTMYWQGSEITIASPSVARKLGIGMVFQHFSLFDALTVAENIALGMDDYIPHAQLHKSIKEISHQYGLPLNPDHQVHSLSVGERQRIEIVRCLLQNPSLLIMDEPTSVLTPQEVNSLFSTLGKLKSEGCSILYISHKLEEIKQLCDFATILRNGKVVEQCDPQTHSVQSLATLMIGTTPLTVNKPDNPKQTTTFRVKELTLKSTQTFGTDLKSIDFSVKSGEIVGIAGVAGNGQAELLSALSGESLTAKAVIEIENQPCGHLNSVVRRDLGMAYVPEDRLGHGAVPSMNLSQNTFLSGYKKQKLISWSGIKHKHAWKITSQIRNDFNVKSSGPGDEAQSLSGGNLQKYIVGREITQQPKVLILGQPTWGVDAGSAAAIHKAIVNLAVNGTAVVIVSQDLEELLNVCDRIAVISSGQLSPFRPIQEVTSESLGLLMGGHSEGSELINDKDKTDVSA